MSNSTLTTNFNYLSPKGFKLSIDTTQFANVEYFMTSFTLPAVSMGSIEVNYRSAKGALPGDKIDYAEISARFLVDENMANYIEVFNWMHSNITSATIAQEDMILSILDSHNRVSQQFRFLNAFPISLAALDFNAQNQDVEYMQSDISFKYDRFELVS